VEDRDTGGSEYGREEQTHEPHDVEDPGHLPTPGSLALILAHFLQPRVVIRELEQPSGLGLEIP
jgi:hypothetical protein